MILAGNVALEDMGFPKELDACQSARFAADLGEVFASKSRVHPQRPYQLAVDVFDPSKSHPDTCFESPADRRTTQAPEGLAPTTSSVASLRAYWGLLYI